ncbi:LytR family transcriptional regulator [Mycetocola tolaasinivorans]|uniref:LytR family transcriptional regulator n=1 Tax=Mycetocola tolaasinivorans TaxID=76635 RepID=A0A3L7A834_9MICO|nr:LCP family protein [Mycetocola tolaasinivorans]RLP75980.1 LytR family transcriptional regulator [Mycetocola tolaasinivorans]
MIDQAERPIRHPNTASPAVMTRRGWWLVLLNFLLPGSAQVLAGNRRLGRLGLISTFTLWLLAIAAGVLALVRPEQLFAFATNSWFLVLAQIVLIAYAVLWFVLAVDTLRLTRIIRATPLGRVAILGLGLAFLVASTGIAGAGAYYANVAGDTLGKLFGASAPPEDPTDGYYNILLLGGDAGPDRSGMRPDSLSVVSINADSGQATMIGLPRDMLNVPFNDTSPMHKRYPNGYNKCDVSACKLNSIYTEAEVRHPDFYPNAKAEGSSPGIEATKDAAEALTGLRIPYYVLVDMQGFADLIDALGGVEVTVDKRLPIGGDENLNGVIEWIEPGTQHMDGYHAQWFARSRHGTSDFDRMERQRQLQEAVLKQFTPANVFSKFQGIADAGTQVVKTDIPRDLIGYFVNLATKTRALPVQKLELTPANGINQDHPDIDQIHGKIRDLLYPKSTPAK